MRQAEKVLCLVADPLMEDGARMLSPGTSGVCRCTSNPRRSQTRKRNVHEVVWGLCCISIISRVDEMYSCGARTRAFIYILHTEVSSACTQRDHAGRESVCTGTLEANFSKQDSHRHQPGDVMLKLSSRRCNTQDGACRVMENVLFDLILFLVRNETLRDGVRRCAEKIQDSDFFRVYSGVNHTGTWRFRGEKRKEEANKRCLVR